MKLYIKILFLGLLLIVLTYSSIKAQRDTINFKNIEQSIDKYLKYFSDENAGAVLTVIKKGDIVFNKAYGLSDIDTKELMKTDKLFDLGELAKSFTAIAVMKLVEKNKIDLNTNLKEIFPNFPDYGKKITIHTILDHKSGLANYKEDECGSNSEVLEFLKKQDSTLFEPGSKFKYSNSDYPLLVSIIEKASNTTYQNFLRKYIFKKLDMDHTYFMDEIKDKNIASAHFKDGDQYVTRNYEFGGVYGEKGIYTSARDYAKYDKALYTDKILNCEILKKIFSVDKLTNQENVSDYTGGWALMARKGVRYFWQGSSSNGYTNLVLHLPDNQTTVLILTNRNDGYDFLKMSIYIAKLFDKELKL